MIQELIDDILAEDQKEERVRSGLWNPSKFGRCLKLQYLDRHNEPKSSHVDARTLRVFKVGHVFHEWIQDLILSKYPDAEIEKKVQTKHLKGFADYVLDDEVGDIKTVHSKSFWYLKKKGSNILEDKKENILQLTTYAILLNKPYIRLVLVSKDDLTIKEYRIKVTFDLKKKVGHELYQLNKYWREQQLPPAKPRAFNGKECKYCNYQEVCLTEEEENMILGGDFLKASEVQNGDEITILDEGQKIKSETFKYPDGNPKINFNVKVKFNEAEKTLTINKASQEALITAWGNDTAKWVGKKASITLIFLPQLKKNMIMLNPVAEV